MGLHRVENPSMVDGAVSLHLYCPPYNSCSMFHLKTGKQTKCNVEFYSKFGHRRLKVRERQKKINQFIRRQKIAFLFSFSFDRMLRKLHLQAIRPVLSVDLPSIRPQLAYLIYWPSLDEFICAQ